MKKYKVYTPWDSIMVEAKNERQAKKRALEMLLSEIESDKGSSFDTEEVQEDEE